MDYRVMLILGQTKTCKRAFTQEDFNRFADLTGDTNPIHVDPGFSATTRFKRTVSHGMLLYSTIYYLISTQFPSLMQLEQELKFPNPAYVGEEFTIKLIVADVIDEEHAKVETFITKQDGTIVCEGNTLVRSADRR